MSTPTIQPHPVGNGERLDDFQLISGISDSVHYPPSIHSSVLLGSSCRADDPVTIDNHPNLQPLSSHNVSTCSNLSTFHKKSQLLSTPTIQPRPVGDGLQLDNYPLISGFSDSVHYPPSIHSSVSLGSSCRTDPLSNDNHPNLQPLSSHVVSTPSNSWIHVYSHKNASSSQRTQCAAIAHFTDGLSGPVRHHRYLRAKKKLKKQQRLLLEVVPPSDQRTFSISKINENIIVFDGGNATCPIISPPKNVKWSRHPVSDLFIPDDIRGDIGLTFRRIDGSLPFIRLPRDISLSIIGKCGLKKIYNALQACQNLRPPLLRSSKKRVFSDPGKPPRYACIGPQASRTTPMIHEHPSFTQKLPSHHWESLLWLMRRAEECFKTIADHQVISHIHHAKKAVPFKTFTSTNPKSSSAKFLGGIAFGTNVFLPCHTDEDFTMSIAQVFLEGKTSYDLNNDVIVYFCFPTLGIAIPLRPGDYLMFNPLIPHFISSRCKHEDDIICLTMYLKTAIVGLNDNSLPLTPSQKQLAEQYLKYKL